MEINKSKLPKGIKEIRATQQRVMAFRDEFSRRRRNRLKEIADLPIDEILKKFSFKEMQLECKNFCSLYAANKTCHQMDSESLICYGCYCPNYKFEVSFDKNKNLYKLGHCSINSKFGFYKPTKTKTQTPIDCLILNCKNCNVPHQTKYIKKYIINDLTKI